MTKCWQAQYTVVHLPTWNWLPAAEAGLVAARTIQLQERPEIQWREPLRTRWAPWPSSQGKDASASPVNLQEKECSKGSTRREDITFFSFWSQQTWLSCTCTSICTPYVYTHIGVHVSKCNCMHVQYVYKSMYMYTCTCILRVKIILLIHTWTNSVSKQIDLC